jgi:hypothetical protein
MDHARILIKLKNRVRVQTSNDLKLKPTTQKTKTAAWFSTPPSCPSNNQHPTNRYTSSVASCQTTLVSALLLNFV